MPLCRLKQKHPEHFLSAALYFEALRLLENLRFKLVRLACPYPSREFPNLVWPPSYRVSFLPGRFRWPDAAPRVTC